MALVLDHLAISAATLEEGREFAEALLGVSLQQGGEHAYFGTHNLLLGLEDGLYLEVISVNPDAPKPEYARWFDLGHFDAVPRLSNWICQTNDMKAAVARFPEAGAPVALSRGDLRWQMAVPENGKLPYDNLFPALIEWQGATHPAKRLAPSGLRLDRFIVCHPDATRLQKELEPVLCDDRIIFEEGSAKLSAKFVTREGRRVQI